MKADSPKRARRPRTDPDVARESVLDAAESLLRSGGPGALRLGTIASLAGLSHSNVLYHFEGMSDLEARLGRRIALRLVAELDALHAERDGPELASDAANAHLFAVLARPENARLISWMLVSSEPAELETLMASIRAAVANVAAHPSFADVPPDVVVREVSNQTLLAITSALGLGIIRPWVSMLFGAPPDEAMFVERISAIERASMERARALLTKRQ